MEEAFRALLQGSAAITALVPAASINWDEQSQGTSLPGVVLNKISLVDGFTLDGPDWLPTARVQVDSYALSKSAVVGLSRAIANALHGYRGGIFHLVQLVGEAGGRDRSTVERPFFERQDFLVTFTRNPS